MPKSTTIKSGFRESIGFEVMIQLVIVVLFALSTSVSRDGGAFQWERIWFLGNYFIAALAVNYILMPRFYYKKKYLSFIIGAILVIVLAILVEELLLEQIFFPDTRGSRFSSIYRTFIRMLPFIMLFVGFKFAWDGQKRQREMDDLKNAVVESQLQFLKSQINPHFLFNSLNNLYSYALEKSDKTPQIILELSSLLRYMLYECQEERVPLSKESKYLHDFVKLQSLQIEDRGNISYVESGNLDGKYIAPLILIVFVENCFKHSTSSQSEKIKIDINLSVHDNILHFSSSNSFTENGNTQSLTEGIGLENVKSRLSLLYPDAHQLQINSDNGEYRVDLEITLD